MDSKYPKVTAVDDTDKVIGYYDLFETIMKRYQRRVSAVLLFNEKNEVLLQKRTDTVLSPNTWDFSAAGHVNEGESYSESAHKELYEELSLSLDLKEVATSLRAPGLFYGFYTGHLPKSTEIHFNPDEVKEVRWISVECLEAEMKNAPETFFCKNGFI